MCDVCEALESEVAGGVQDPRMRSIVDAMVMVQMLLDDYSADQQMKMFADAKRRIQAVRRG